MCVLGSSSCQAWLRDSILSTAAVLSIVVRSTSCVLAPVLLKLVTLDMWSPLHLTLCVQLVTNLQVETIKEEQTEQMVL